MMKEQNNHDPSKPTYRIVYEQCKAKPSHQGEKLNYICLKKQCHEHSLICSLCKDEEHDKHEVKPLKYYLAELKNKYCKNQKKEGQNYVQLQKRLQNLENSKILFMMKLTDIVSKIAQEFRKLEQDFLERVDHIKSEILQEISKRNKFQQFYNSLTTNSLQNVNFLLQNYLPAPTIGQVSNIQKLDSICHNICHQIQQTKSHITIRKNIEEAKHKIQEIGLQEYVPSFKIQKYLTFPANITFKDNMNLTQTMFGGYPAPKNMALLDYNFKNISGKIKVKLTKVRKGGKVIMGCITKQAYNSMNGNWNSALVNQQSGTFISTDGFHGTFTISNIKGASQGTSFQFSVFKNTTFKIIQKNKVNEYVFPPFQMYMFFVLIGQCSIQIRYVN